MLKFNMMVKIVFNFALATAIDKDNMFNMCLKGLLDVMGEKAYQTHSKAL
jgi:hypothetical protein